MSTSPSTTTTTGNSNRGGVTIGGGLGSAVRGAFQTVQGVGDSIRENAMDLVDNATGTSRHQPETDVGRAQTEHGIERIEARRRGAPEPTHTANTQQTSPATTTTAPPPLPPRTREMQELGSAGETNGAVVGNEAEGH